jgi:voltage-gated sodium channel
LTARTELASKVVNREIAMLDRVKAILESRRFETVITALIIINAATLGFETAPDIMARWGGMLHAIDKVLLTIFVGELIAKILVYRGEFFKSGWNLFDFVIIAIALVPAAGSLSVLRALRVLRVLRLITVIPSLKRVVGAMIAALPGMGSIIVLLLLVFYVSAVMATKLFQATEPEAFGDLGRSFYTLFQLMTLDGWSGEIVKPVLKNHPYAMLFFMPFILFSAFVVLNLFIGVVVGAMQDEASEARAETDKSILSTDQAMLSEIKALRSDIEALRAQIGKG